MIELDGDRLRLERRILFLLGAMQFVNVVDFMMVLPLGPDFARGLNVSLDRLGLVAGSYTAAAAVSGAAASPFLDRFDRRSALFVSMLGLVAGTAVGGFATGLGSLLVGRVIAGAFGGPASALGLAIIADVVPLERRGRAMGAVAGAFAIASVFGVPAGLQLAQYAGWRVPFFAVAGTGLVVAVAAAALMPPLKAHLSPSERANQRPFSTFLQDPSVRVALVAMAALMMGMFCIMSNMSAFLQANLRYPRGQLAYLYMAGGFVSFFAMRGAGILIDKRGAVTTMSVATGIVALGIALLFLGGSSRIPVLPIFVAIMVGNVSRVVSFNALTSRVPAPMERARYMAAQSATQQLATAIGATGSSWILRVAPNGDLEHMPALAAIAIGLSLLVPALLARLHSKLDHRPVPSTPAVTQ